MQSMSSGLDQPAHLHSFMRASFIDLKHQLKFVADDISFSFLKGDYSRSGEFSSSSSVILFFNP